MCEKPYAVTEEDLRAAENLEELIEYENRRGVGIVGKITAHFAHKPASLVLFEEIDRLIVDYGKIRKITGFYEEIDDPNKPRTIATLNLQKSGGGIYQDTGSHLEMILLALGGVPGGIREVESPIHISNVMLICPKCNQTTRVKFGFLKDGKKARFCKKCGEMIL